MFKILSNFCEREIPESSYKFVVEGEILGYVRKDFIQKLSSFFSVDHNTKTIHFPSDLSSKNEKNEWLAKQFRKLSEEKAFKCIETDKWRNELYPVYNSGGEVSFLIERSAISVIGCRTFGTHLNGFIRETDKLSENYGKVSKIWVAKRSKTKQTNPSLLDNLCGGGLGIIKFDELPPTTLQNIIKEAEEEASMPNEISCKEVVASGFISFFTNNNERGLIFDTEYVFDIDLTSYKDIYFPYPKDGEVESFMLLGIHEVKEKLINSEFTPEASFVMVDFMVRHGIITRDNEDDYLNLVQLLRSGIHGLYGPK
jgi:hypothetical protein